MDGFFTGVPNGDGIVAFGLLHIGVLVVFVAVLVLIWLARHRLAGEVDGVTRPWGRILEVALALVLLVQQASLYTWYYTTGYHVPLESLPLYHCRIAIILLAISTLAKWRLVQSAAAIWGMLGAIGSLAVADADAFAWPHLTLVSFIVGHAVLGWLSALVIARGDARLRPLALILAAVVTPLHMLATAPIDFALDANYSYITKAPIFNDVAMSLPLFVRGAAIVAVEIALLGVAYLILWLYAPKERSVQTA